MLEGMWNLFRSPTFLDTLYGACGVLLLLGIASFSVLAGRAEARMWRAVHRRNGERRALQYKITLGRSHLR
jgi:hypothetical protein